AGEFAQQLASRRVPEVDLSTPVIACSDYFAVRRKSDLIYESLAEAHRSHTGEGAFGQGDAVQVRTSKAWGSANHTDQEKQKPHSSTNPFCHCSTPREAQADLTTS